MAVEMRASPTLGTLLRLRRQLEFIRRGKEVLEMKRDHLAGEVNKLLAEERAMRGEVERELMDAYGALKIAYSRIGYWGVLSSASSVKGLELGTGVRSVMGVEMPRAEVEAGPDLKSVAEATAYEAAERISLALRGLVRLAEVEAGVERMALELMATNRKVNALEYIVIPGFVRQIKYIEDVLEEETLEEFFKAKRMRAIVRAGRR